MCPMHFNSDNLCAECIRGPATSPRFRRNRGRRRIRPGGGPAEPQPAGSLAANRGLGSGLGVPLFDRLGRRALLTSEGEDLLRRSRRLLSDAESLGERARELKGGHTGLLRVGATPQAMETLLAGFLARYRRRHPDVEVHLVEDGGARLPARLEHGDVHLTLIAAGDARFRWRGLGPVYLLAVLPPSHRWSRRAMLEIKELADAPLLITRRDFNSRAWFEAACQMAHIRPHVLGERRASDAPALAQAEYGIAIVPSNSRIPRGLRAVPIVRGRADWSLVEYRVGSSALPGAVRRAVRRRAGRVLAAGIPAPAPAPAAAAAARPREQGNGAAG